MSAHLANLTKVYYDFIVKNSRGNHDLGHLG